MATTSNPVAHKSNNQPHEGQAALPHFDGQTYDPALDHKRLSSQLIAVRNFLLNANGWHTLAEIKHHVELELGRSVSEASISARTRDLRKVKFGGYEVKRERSNPGGRGTWVYRIFPEPDREDAMNEKQKTSHDYADSLVRLAEFLKSKPAFEIPESDATAQLFLYWPDKHYFLALARTIHGGKKEYHDGYSGRESDKEISYTVEIPTGERVKARIQRSKMCRLIRPAVYDCEPFFSQEEEAEIGA